MNKFKIGSLTFDYYRKDGYNSPHLNDRTIELPLFEYFKNKFNDIIEIGAVSPYYFESMHKIIDLYDNYTLCIRQDATKLDYVDLNVISISTFEHIGKGDFDNTINHDNAFNLLNKIIKQAKNYLITFPIGYHKEFDNLVKNSSIKKIVMKRVNQENEWQYDGENFDFKFAWPFPWGNGNCIITNIQELRNDEI